MTPLLARIMWISRVSRGFFASPLSANDMLGNEVPRVAVVDWEGMGSEDWGRLSWVFCDMASLTGASVSAILVNRGGRGEGNQRCLCEVLVPYFSMIDAIIPQ